MKLLSLFSGCGGMDIGFEGDFWCLKKSINYKLHSDWIREEAGDWVKVAPTVFETVLLMIFVQMQKLHGYRILVIKSRMLMKSIIWKV